jgi:hypothetical protein
MRGADNFNFLWLGPLHINPYNFAIMINRFFAKTEAGLFFARLPCIGMYESMACF